MAWTLNTAYDPITPAATAHGPLYAYDDANGHQILWPGVGAAFVAVPAADGPMEIAGRIIIAGPTADVFARAERLVAARAVGVAG